jgi:hypothetical protein
LSPSRDFLTQAEGLHSEDDAGSLLQQGYHSVHEQTSGYMVLFHPDAVVVTQIIYLGPDDSVEAQISTEMLQLEAARDSLEQQREMKLKV